MSATVGDEPSGWLTWWRSQGATSQAFVPGLYAWAITVEPVAWSRDAGIGAKVAGALALLALGLGPVLERRSPGVVRMASGWGVVMSSIVVWVLAPDGAFATFDAARGIAGMLGWALFAFASASPARQATVGLAPGPPLRPRTQASRVDTPLLFLGLALAAGLELAGWRVVDRDRALLLRLLALAGGLGLVTAAGALAISRGAPLDEDRVPRPRRQRLSTRMVVWSTLAFGLLGLGAIYELWLAR
jgi:hypothetical protein